MNEELDYAEMLEIPVNTVKVVKKKSLFPKRNKEKSEDLKEQALESVNDRINDFVYPEDLTVPELPPRAKIKLGKSDIVLIAETAMACALAIGIFATNVFMPNSAINTFIGYFAEVPQTESVYTDVSLSPVVSQFSDTEVGVSEGGIIFFTDNCAVYPVAEGTVSAVYENEGGYTVEIAHTSTFSSVVTGVDTVYYKVGESVKSGVPVAYSNGEAEVRISMYNDGALLSNYSLSGAVPVWNT